MSPLCRYPSFNVRTRHTDELNFGVSTPLPTHTITVWVHPLSGFGSLSEFHPCITASDSAKLAPSRYLAPPEVCSPTAYFQPCGATFLRRFPYRPVKLRPQGFAPSRRFAPHMTYRAYFIPIPLMGFSLRGLNPSAAPYVLSNAGSLMGLG